MLQDHPGLEVRFIVAGAEDEGIIDRILERHPDRGRRVVAGPSRVHRQPRAW